MSGEIRFALRGGGRRDRVGGIVARAWDMIWSGGYLWGVAISLVFSLTFSITVLSATAVCLGKSPFAVTMEKAKKMLQRSASDWGFSLPPSSSQKS